MYVEASKFAPTRFKTRIQTVVSEKIPTEFNNKSIAVISNPKGDISAINKSIAAIKESHSDLVIIMGDVFDPSMDEETASLYEERLASIQVPLGKFVLSDSHQPLLKELGFYVLNNTSTQVHAQGNASINVISRMSNETVQVDEDSFNLLISNIEPDDSFKLADVLISPILEDQKINLPYLLNDFKKTETKDGSISIKHMQSNTQSDYRLFSNPEIVILSLKSQ